MTRSPKNVVVSAIVGMVFLLSIMAAPSAAQERGYKETVIAGGPDKFAEVRQKQDTLKVVTLARIQFAPGVVFHPITRLTQVGNFDTNSDNISIVVISRKNGTFVAIYRI
jgi:hypothetical protein